MKWPSRSSSLHRAQHYHHKTLALFRIADHAGGAVGEEQELESQRRPARVLRRSRPRCGCLSLRSCNTNALPCLSRYSYTALNSFSGARRHQPAASSQAGPNSTAERERAHYHCCSFVSATPVCALHSALACVCAGVVSYRHRC